MSLGTACRIPTKRRRQWHMELIHLVELGRQNYSLLAPVKPSSTIGAIALFICELLSISLPLSQFHSKVADLFRFIVAKNYSPLPLLWHSVKLNNHRGPLLNLHASLFLVIRVGELKPNAAKCFCPIDLQFQFSWSKEIVQSSVFCRVREFANSLELFAQF